MSKLKQEEAIEIAATQMYAKPSRRVVLLRGLGDNRDSVPLIWYDWSVIHFIAIIP